MLWASVAYASGIVTGFYIWRPPLWWLIAAIVFAASAAFFLRSRAKAAFALGFAALFVAGAWTMQVRMPTNHDADILAFADGREVIVTAHVVKEGILQEKSRGDVQQRLDLRTEHIQTGSETVTVDSGLRVSFYGHENKEDVSNESEASDPQPIHWFRYGERLRFPTKLYPPRNFRNPGAFDYTAYLADNGIVAIGSTKLETVELLPGFAGSRAELWRTRVRRSLIGRIHILWKPDESALLDAILIGENSFLGRETLTDFQRTGTYHILVISGLKVAILALVIFWLLRRMRVGDLVASAITILLTVAYAVLTDVGAPVWRATLMLALYLSTRLLYRRKSILNTIGAAALALLIVDPTALLGASFQLTFLCVLVIAGISAPILERTTQPLSRALRSLNSIGYDAALTPSLAQVRLDLRMVNGRLQRFFGKRIPLIMLSGSGRLLLVGCEFLMISTVLQAGFALPMAYYFHRATLVSLPANVLAVPLTEIIMIAAIVAITTSYASLTLAKLPALMAAVALHAMNGPVRWLGALRIADTRVPTPQLGVILLGTGALVLAMVLSRRRRWSLVAAGWIALALSAFWICAVPPHPQVRQGLLELTAIDVGQGDSILLVSPQGRTLLVDAGGIPFWMHSELDIGEDVVSPYLWSRGFHQLDIVALTHAHADHMGGMAAVLANFHPRELWLGVDSPSPELQTLLREAKALEIPIILHKAGDNLEIGGAKLAVLAPPRDAEAHPSRPNDESLVIKISYGATSALLEGDAEKKTEKQVAQENPQADLLKVAHHGSSTSTIPELLAAVHPRFAVISVGTRNVYGHPRQEVLDRLAAAHVLTYRTDMDGAVTFYLDGKTVSSQLAALR
ncbi:MAG TPA: ComEC/Rec2 family competence protein [Terriglobales bacterium]|nr:ComEC/Rec2 family competence protein [Terriglobales bacterium]